MVLIDGAMVQNDPSDLSYIHAKYHLKKDKVRVISIGTGIEKIDPIYPSNSSIIDWTSQYLTFFATIEQTASSYFMLEIVEDAYRFQVQLNETLSIDDTDQDDMHRMLFYADYLIDQKKDEMQEALRKVVD